jgi:hypothetical protein
MFTQRKKVYHTTHENVNNEKSSFDLGCVSWFSFFFICWVTNIGAGQGGEGGKAKETDCGAGGGTAARRVEHASAQGIMD